MAFLLRSRVLSYLATFLPAQPVIRTTGLVAAAVFAVALRTGASPGFAAEGPDSKTVTERFKSWTVTCVEAETRSCQMTQELVQKETGKRLSAVVVETGRDGDAVLTVLTPFGLAFAEGLQVSIDNAEPGRADFLTCMPSGCIVPVPLEADILERIRAGNTLTVSGATAATGKPVRIEFALTGSAAALARLLELSSPSVAE